ncbi:GNAT family N-acetyltransferase [Chitinophaga pinensis]|uniref:GCN5-related N-acetyltransferase n=1 Tax=Chitinophaga pinensis (strain ATCC 43595 / DSM 2588 / LMG 13176 / NBRC 15968 / NCIMB 11800 / UQM 2034) TaxID=485918 RepID=A0A979G9K1_CHIPD|nr:GNAT family N-acetyltransferase [Chitinophaga pinensis]ACU63207.1 GCN5-related N-acetyltransferase [Chitinophaga pinensis DSM 2588]
MNGAIYVRHVSVKDAAQVAALSAELGYPSTVKDTITYIQAIDKSICDVAYVAVSGETVLGWIHVCYTIRLESGPFCEIGGLVVSRNTLGKGIGRLLVEKAKKWSAERNIEKLRVRSNVIREGSHAFYVKTGFVEYKQQKVFEYTIGAEVLNEKAAEGVKVVEGKNE